MQTDHELLLDIRSTQDYFHKEVLRRLDRKAKLLVNLDERTNNLEKNDIKMEGRLTAHGKSILKIEACLAKMKEMGVATPKQVKKAVDDVKEDNRRSLKIWVTITAIVTALLTTIVVKLAGV